MMGTLASVMAGKKIRTFKDRFIASVTGDIEEVNGTLKITRIDVRYLLKLPDQQRESALESFNNYIEFCPGAQSVIGCIDINHHLDMEKKED
jgi:organic hydroperoxide reductase OsmC/OhrA